MDRVILHCDCNAFFASVELLGHPELSVSPVAVGLDDGSRHGVVLAKNECAKRYGVRTAETIAAARRKCPGLVILPPHHEKYSRMSERVNAIYGQYTDLVEPFSVDESWLDLTGSLHLFGKTGPEFADELRRRVREECGITISVGVSFNKVFAKIGSDYKKPDATTVIGRADVPKIIWPMPVENMLFVGSAAAGALRGLGIGTIGGLAAADDAMLAAALGKTGPVLRAWAAGLDSEPVRPLREAGPARSVGNGFTFRRDLAGEDDIRTGVLWLADEVAARLRRSGLCCRGVQVAVKDTELHVIQRQMQLARPTDLQSEITQAAVGLILRSWDLRRPIRALTVTAIDLQEAAAPRQIGLFDEESTPGGGRLGRRRRLEKTVDGLRERYGKESLTQAAVLGSDLGLAKRKPAADGGNGKDGLPPR